MTTQVEPFSEGVKPVVLSGFSAFLEICRRWGLFAALSVVMFAYLLYSQYENNLFIRDRLMTELQMANESRTKLAEELRQSTDMRQRTTTAMEANAKLLDNATQLMQRCVIRFEETAKPKQ